MNDRLFAGLTRGAGLSVLALLAAIAVFLVVKALPAFDHGTTNFWTTEAWRTEGDRPTFGVAAIAFGTVLSSGVGLVLA